MNANVQELDENDLDNDLREDEDDDNEDDRQENDDDLGRSGQITVMGRIKTNKLGSEIITLRIPLGKLGTILVIQNVPDEGRDRAPAYCRIVPNERR